MCCIQVARETEDITKRVPLDSRRLMQQWQGVVARMDKVLADLASVASSGHVTADGRASSCAEYAQVVTSLLQPVRDEAEERVTQTEGILLLAESPLADVLEAEARLSQGAGRGDERERDASVYRELQRELQLLQVQTAADKRRMLATELETIELFQDALADALHGQVIYMCCDFAYFTSSHIYVL
jgi:hypothetical protein